MIGVGAYHSFDLIRMRLRGSSLSSVISLNETGWTAPPASSGSKIRRLSLGNKVRMTQA